MITIKIPQTELIEILSTYSDDAPKCVEEMELFIKMIAYDTAISHAKDVIKNTGN